APQARSSSSVITGLITQSAAGLVDFSICSTGAFGSAGGFAGSFGAGFGGSCAAASPDNAIKTAATIRSLIFTWHSLPTRSMPALEMSDRRDLHQKLRLHQIGADAVARGRLRREKFTVDLVHRGIVLEVLEEDVVEGDVLERAARRLEHRAD